MTASQSQTNGAYRTAMVSSHVRLCREHYRLTLQLRDMDHSKPGQFVHISPALLEKEQIGDCRLTTMDYRQPFLRRAFSIADHRQVSDGWECDVLYRVVGTGTRWMEKLGKGDAVSVLGPLGNHFPIDTKKKNAWMVAGGVGLPPMMYLAKSLAKADRDVIGFFGAQSADLLALALDGDDKPDTLAQHAVLADKNFAQSNVAIVVSTDDGSCGFPGHIGSALQAYHQNNPVANDELVVYTCGPEVMMRFVAGFCRERGIDCYVCMERSMACGIGTCQSCVVPIHDQDDEQGWRYQLCCTEGPVFSEKDISWDFPS